jgi:hypothetical protein
VIDWDSLEYIAFKLILPKVTILGAGTKALDYQVQLRLFKRMIKCYSEASWLKLMTSGSIEILVRGFLQSPNFEEFVLSDTTLKVKAEAYLEFRDVALDKMENRKYS